VSPIDADGGSGWSVESCGRFTAETFGRGKLLRGKEAAAGGICVKLMRELSTDDYSKSIGVYGLVFELKYSNTPTSCPSTQNSALPKAVAEAGAAATFWPLAVVVSGLI